MLSYFCPNKGLATDLEKPIMMVSVPNHIEQEINAWDGQRAGAGIADAAFKLTRFISYMPVYQNFS